MQASALPTRLFGAIKGYVRISTLPVDKCVHGFGAGLRKARCIKGLLDPGEKLAKDGFSNKVNDLRDHLEVA